jgi:hypothetical protein
MPLIYSLAFILLLPLLLLSINDAEARRANFHNHRRAFLDKAKAKADEVIRNQSSSGKNQSGSNELPFHTGNLYGGSNSSAHHHGQCPNFSAPHLKSQRPIYPNPGKAPPGPGSLPPRVKNITYHDRMQFYRPDGRRHDVLRDLGFSGVLDGRIIWAWGDTLMGKEGSEMICAQDSTSIGTLDAPMVTVDTALHSNGKFVCNWIPCTPEEENEGGHGVNAFGGTNVLEIAPTKGVVFYLKNHRPGGLNHIVGAGVATCQTDENNVPHAVRNGEKMWEEYEPWWGDVGIALDERDGMVYAFGHGPGFDGEVAARTYLCRVPKDRVTDINAYEYWLNGQRKWTKQRLGDGSNGTLRLSTDMAIFGEFSRVLSTHPTVPSTSPVISPNPSAGC